MKRKLFLLSAIFVGAVLAAGALAASTATPGVTDSTIEIGGTAPLSGEASSAAGVAKGAQAYFAYVNDHGGVFGRKIDYKVLDDAYDPARTVQDVRQLVQQDNVFALFNTLGTNQNLAIRDFVNQLGVPQLFVASGANTWGADYKKYPWTIGYIPSYVLEGEVYAHYVIKNIPKARIGVIYQDDDYGHDLLDGLRLGLGSAHKKMLVSAVGYDPTAADVQSQVAQVKSSKANVFMIFAFGKFGVQSFIFANKLGWHPQQIFVNAVASSANLMTLATLTGSKRITTGAISIVFFKDPTDPRWASDKGLALFHSILKQYAPGASPNDGYYGAGMASAFTLVDTLKKAGQNLTRDGVMKAALSLNEANNPFVIPGIVIKTSPADHFPMEQVGLERWNGTHWVGFGKIVTAKG
jgi:branched-chain amino acid transport system substrate-binding protein